jgi:demethylmenaquinone methyltransferase/2-methoxy-6-polyprenyl-1,4-benzoquinol methylase
VLSELEGLLAEQAHYYRERAGEYEDWWFRRGRYNRGPEADARWFAEASEVQAALERFHPAGEVLELACGTGLWTQRLVAHAAAVTAVDGSPEMLELCRARVNDQRVSYIQADLFAWEPDRAYDVCFFGFWLSHVPEERFETFWQKVKQAIEPGGRVFFVDSLRSERASAADHKLPDPDDQTMLRRLADGREYRIIKRFHEPHVLQQRLAGVGWNAHVNATPEFFLYGHATPAL